MLSTTKAGSLTRDWQHRQQNSIRDCIQQWAVTIEIAYPFSEDNFWKGHVLQFVATRMFCGISVSEADSNR